MLENNQQEDKQTLWKLNALTEWVCFSLLLFLWTPGHDQYLAGVAKITKSIAAPHQNDYPKLIFSPFFSARGVVKFGVKF